MTPSDLKFGSKGPLLRVDLGLLVLVPRRPPHHVAPLHLRAAHGNVWGPVLLLAFLQDAAVVNGGRVMVLLKVFQRSSGWDLLGRTSRQGVPCPLLLLLVVGRAAVFVRQGIVEGRRGGAPKGRAPRVQRHGQDNGVCWVRWWPVPEEECCCC